MTISCEAPHASRLVVVGQWGGAGGAVCEDHFGGKAFLRDTRRRVELLYGVASVLKDASL